MKLLILLAVMVLLFTQRGASEPSPAPLREIRLIAGPASHGRGEHEFPRGVELLAESLNASGLPVRAHSGTGWPEPDTLANTDVLVVFSDGLGDHVAKGQADSLRAHLDAGRSLVVLHFALEPPEDDLPLKQGLLEGVGGVFEAGWSVNPIWVLDAAPIASHPVARGVGTIKMKDEWYYHLRFRESAMIQPVLVAHPGEPTLGADGPRSGNPAVRAALARGEAQVVAWTVESPDGRRGFGFTGGHYHGNWYNRDFRTLVLNGIVWAAGLAVPEEGVPSPDPTLPIHERLDDSIAQGDADDVARHLRLDPTRAQGGSGGRLPPLHQAILRRQPEIALQLIAHGADIERADTSGRTPLHLAVIRESERVVEALLQGGADGGRRDQQGWTPLHHAAARKQTGLARRLLEHGSDPNVLSGLGGTPLHEAAASGAVEVARLLLAAGTDPNVRSQTGVTALDLAREFQQAELIALLESAPAP